MKEDLQRLITLQEIDSRFEEIIERKRRIPELVDAAGRPLEAADETLTAVQQEYEASTKDRKASEQDLATQEQLIAKLQDRALKGEIKTNKEYQAHLFEVELAKKKKGEVEERLLLLMEQVDMKKKELADAEAARKQAEQRFAAEKIALESSAGPLEEELASLRQRRATVASAVEPSLLRTYEKLRATRKGLAMAGVDKDGNCLACRLQVQPQVIAEVKRASKIRTCSYCHRILYWAGDPVQIVATPERRPEEEPEEAAETTE